MSTKNIIPRSSGEGQIGLENRPWSKANFNEGNFLNSLFVEGEDVIEKINQISGVLGDLEETPDINILSGLINQTGSLLEADIQEISGVLSVPKENSVNTSSIIDGSVTSAKIADDSIASNHIINGSISSVDLADKSVTSSKLEDSIVIDQDLSVGGDLFVSGSTVTVDASTIIVEDKNIEIGSTDNPTNITADGGGITLKGETDKTILWLNSSSAWTFSEDVAGKGPGGRLTLGGLPYLVEGDSVSFEHWSEDGGNFVPNDNRAYDLGSQSSRVKNLFGSSIDIMGSNSIGTFFKAQNDGAAGAEFKRVSNSSPYNHFLFSNGNVGIGVASPSYTLDVAGNINFAGNLTQNGVAFSSGASDFTELTDTPGSLSSKSYLRVNAAGTAIEQVKTAPPDGGLGGNSLIQSASNFDGKLPDALIMDGGTGGTVTYTLTFTDTGLIQYVYWTDGSSSQSYYLNFNNDSTGSGFIAAGRASSHSAPNCTSLQDFIDNGRAIFHGQKSGASGVGKLGVISQQVENFYTDLPDAIVATMVGGYESILRLKFVVNITDQPNGNNFYYEARVNTVAGNTSDHLMIFRDDTDGTFMGFAGQNDNLPTDGSMDQNLRWFIENGRALYFGSQPSTSRVGQLEHVRNTIPLASSIELPDAIMDTDLNASRNQRVLLFEKVDDTNGHFQYLNANSSSGYYIRFDSTSGQRIAKGTQSQGDFNTLQEYISNGKALYFGGTAAGGGATKFTGLEDTPATLEANKILKTDSTGDQVILVDDVEITSIGDIQDVQTSGSGHDPSDGDALVWNESHGHWMPGEISSTFTDLTDTPASLSAGSYLRVNAAGDGVEHINTPPPDGGLGSNPHVTSRNKTGIPLPDKVAFIWGGNYFWLTLSTITEGSTGAIYYHRDIGDNDFMRVVFKNEPGGANVGDSSYVNGTSGRTRYFVNSSSSYSQASRDVRTRDYSLEQFIDNNMAFYTGAKSGTTGAGNLNVIKQAAEQFYTDLPDAIVATQNSGYECILRLKFAKNITDQSNGSNFYYEARVQAGSESGSSNDYLLVFKDDVDGTFMGHAGQADQLPPDGSMDQNLRWFIENGRALYYGSQPSTSRIGQSDDVRDAVSLVSSVEIPDAILDHDAGENTSGGDARMLLFEKYNDSHFQYQAANQSSYYVRFDSTTGARVQKSSNSNGDFGSIQEYISNGRALYFGGAGSGQTASINEIGDVQTSGSGHDPADGDALVWNESHGHWMPGEVSSTFADLTDTPSTLDAGSYLRVNSTGDGVEQIKTAPPDGGLGDNSAIQAASNFDGKLPDSIVVTNPDGGQEQVLRLQQINTSLNSNPKITYRHEDFGDSGADYDRRIVFVNDTDGTLDSQIHYTSTQNLRWYVDNGRAIFHGQKSGTSGAGSLTIIKNTANTSANGGFYTELPDAIYSFANAYDGIFRLHWVKPNSSTSDTSWEIVYRAEAFTSGDYFIGFKLDADGTNATPSASKVAGISKSQNLRWFIENGRALYYSSTSSAPAGGSTVWNQSGNNINYTTGNVGIGTTNPLYSLTINTEDEDHLRFENGAEAGFIRLTDEGALDIWAHGSSEVTFRTGTGDGTETMRIDSSGNVGIGTTSPQYTLDLKNTSDTCTLVLRGNDTFSDGDVASQVFFVGTDNTSTPRGLAKIKVKEHNSALGTGSLHFETRINGVDSDKMVIDSSGNVGIGTTSPAHNLHIVTGTPGMKLEGSQPRIWLRETDQTDLNTLIRNNNGIFEIDTVNNSDAYVQNRFAINHGNGNVRINDLLGIGKDPDGYHLDIASPGAAGSGIRVQTNNTSANAITHIGGGGSSDVKFQVNGAGNITSGKITVTEDANVGFEMLKSTGTSIFTIGEDGGGNTVLTQNSDSGGNKIIFKDAKVDFDGGEISNFSSPINAQTGTSYTLTLSDRGKVLTFDNASDITVTVAPSLEAGFSCTCIQLGEGQVIFAPAYGVTLSNMQSHTKIAGNKGMVTLASYAADTFILSGDTA